jgi:high frequency lysogenization protein
MREAVNLRNRTLALAGVFQAARLVQQLAHDGRVDIDAFSTSIHSILTLDARDTDEVFDGARGMRQGLELLRSKLGGAEGTPLDVEIARYVVSMVHLAGQLRRRTDIQDTIRRGIDTAEEQMKFFESSEDNAHPILVEKLAELYVQTLGTLPPRIMVTGEQGFLVNPLIASKVRASLFAGVRAAFLWRQLGGRRWHLLFSRRRIAGAATRVLGEIS